ncbi:MAG TPA: DUF2298 domain-containing protein [Ktedonobacterales bacterium]|nr:DUF2298 domain-containing protein [Ktedonobacterales bacterium]
MSRSPNGRSRKKSIMPSARTLASDGALAITTGRAPETSTETDTQSASAALRRRGLALWRWAVARDWTPWLIGLIALMALGLRLYGINWDANNHLHPDEREIVFRAMCLNFPGQARGSGCDSAYTGPNWFFSPNSPLNPHFFAYGSFPLYLLAAVAHALAWLTSVTHGAFHPSDGGSFDDFNHFTLIGRTLSALFDTGSVVVAGLLGRRLAGRWAGALAAAFVAVIPFEVQVAHFYAVDTPTLFFILLTLWACLALAQHATRRPAESLTTRKMVARDSWQVWLYGLLAGVGVALAIASKVSAAPLAAPMLLACVYTWRRRGAEAGILAAAGMVAAAILTFLITSPYVLIDWKEFIAQVSEQTALSQGKLDYPYVRQFAGTTPFLYQLQQMLLYDMGIPLGTLGLAGLGWALSRIWRRWDDDWGILLAWVIPYFIIIGDAYTKFTRYMLPVFAPLAICGAGALVALAGWGMARLSEPGGPRGIFALGLGRRLSTVWGAQWARGVCVVLGLAILLATGLNALALDAIYSAPNTRVQASEWIYNHVPRGAVITSEVWDDSLPMEVPPARMGANGQGYTAAGAPIDPGQYGSIGLDLYADDTPQKAATLATSLATASVVVISSQRLIGSIPKLPDRYPMTDRYYQMLFAGDLGFHLAATFSASPHLGPLTYGDHSADESFSVYDHPPVWIFTRTGDGLTQTQLVNALTQGIDFAQVTSRAGSQKPLTLSAQNAAADAQSPTLDAQFAPDSLPNRIPLLWWLLIVELLGLVSFPLAFVVFPGLRDRGWGFSKLLGLLVMAWLVWFPSSLRLLPFDRWAVALMFGVVALAGALVTWRLRERLWRFVTARWRLLVINEAFFLAAFLAFTWIRALDPDLWHIYRGGEKPMEIAFIDGLLRSRYMPPLDPWFAGGAINYYYYGQYLAAVLIKLTGIVPTTAFNLMIPLLFAVCFSGAFSLLAGLTRRWWAGAAGGVALVVVSNLNGVQQVWSNVNTMLAKQLPAPFDYWASSRVIPFTINEFPFWSFLYADLHAHVIDLPIVVMIVGLAASLLARARRDGGRLRPAIPTLAVAALALGATWLVNTWDLPVCALLIVAALTLRLFPFGAGSAARWMQAREALRWPVVRMWALAVGATLGATYALYLPFHATFQNFTTGIGPVTTPTDPQQFAVLFGLWLFLIVSFLAVELCDRLRRDLGPALAEMSDTFLMEPIALWLIGAAVIAATALALFISLKVALALLLLLTLYLGLDLRHSPARVMTYTLIALGLAIALGVELVYIRDFLDHSAWERMNTVFKFYYQVWVCFSLGGALAFTYLIRRALHLLPVSETSADASAWDDDDGAVAPSIVAPRPVPSGVAPRALWVFALALLLSGSLIFNLLGTQARVADPAMWAAVQPPPDGVQPEGPSLDGMAYMRGWYPEDYAAITWINAHIAGAPTIVEASGSPYMWYSRVAIYTGLPDVLGWGNHESQQRYPDQIWARQNAVTNFYATNDPGAALTFLKDYDVSYVYLGGMERDCYTTNNSGQCQALPADALAKFSTLERAGVLRPVFSDGATTLYRVVGQ